MVTAVDALELLEVELDDGGVGGLVRTPSVRPSGPSASLPFGPAISWAWVRGLTGASFSCCWPLVVSTVAVSWKSEARWILVARVCRVSLASMVTFWASPPEPLRIEKLSPALSEVAAVSSCEGWAPTAPFGRPSRSSTEAPVGSTAIAFGWERSSAPCSDVAQPTVPEAGSIWAAKPVWLFSSSLAADTGPVTWPVR